MWLCLYVKKMLLDPFCEIAFLGQHVHFLRLNVTSLSNINDKYKTNQTACQARWLTQQFITEMSEAGPAEDHRKIPTQVQTHV